MKYSAMLLLVLSCLWAYAALAGEQKKGVAVVKNPVVIQGGTSQLMNVTFLHRDHIRSGIKCAHCHHDDSMGSRYLSCSECHVTPGARERDTMSMFMAFHAKGTDRSCYGCHSGLAEKEPDKYTEFRNCRPCHISPQAREIAEEAEK